MRSEGISDIEHGISNDEVFSSPIASAFDIPCSIFDIFFLLHAWSQPIADIGQTVTDKFLLLHIRVAQPKDSNRLLKEPFPSQRTAESPF